MNSGEICRNGPARHGVPIHLRRNPYGARFNSFHDNYQDGICEVCGQLVFSTRKNMQDSFHPWRLKQYTIYEEDSVEDLQTVS